MYRSPHATVATSSQRAQRENKGARSCQSFGLHSAGRHCDSELGARPGSHIKLYGFESKPKFMWLAVPPGAVTRSCVCAEATAAVGTGELCMHQAHSSRGHWGAATDGEPQCQWYRIEPQL
jgi:hypothetical protein